MTNRASRKNAALAWATPVLCEFAALGRSVVLARMLGAEELGKVMMLALALRLAEMACDVSIERLLIQAPDGDAPGFLNALQGAVLLRGLALAGILLILALPMAASFSDGPAALSVAALALVALLRGFVSLDYRRREREFDYRGLLVVEGGAAAAMLAAAPIAAALIGDHRAFVPVVLVHGFAQLALSHAVSRIRWQVRIERAILVRVTNFGAPLLANAVLLFLIFHGDRLIIAGFFDWADLGRYAVALQLALLPAQIAGRAAGSLLAPALRRASAEGTFDQAAAHADRLYLVLSAVFLAGFVTLANPAITLVYGLDFAIGLDLAFALGAIAAIRISRTPLSQQAIALGHTNVPARANVLRVAAVPVALLLAWAGAPLAVIAMTGAAGELLAAWRATQLLRTLRPDPVNPGVPA